MMEAGHVREVAMVVVLVHYVKPLEEVDRLVPSHKAFLAEYYRRGLLLLSGPRTPRTEGGLILARSGSVEELRALFAKDPFAVAGVAEYEFLAFEPTMRAGGTEPFLAAPAAAE
ncbi:MAG: YciI family protein [Acidobacteriota bacterium]